MQTQMQANIKHEHEAQALRIKNTLGVRCAAGYLRNRGYTAFAAVEVLAYFKG
jgi:hypothetical protein